ncbi:MAG: zf-TFIIB domain-containing protein [Myxococcota bacterium]
MSRCPICTASLEPCKQGAVTVQLCPNEHGMTVPNNRLIPLLEQIARTIEIDPEAPIDAVASPEAANKCPACQKTMTRFGYMGTTLVELDRCAPCGLLWIDMVELDALARLYGRTNKRARQRQDRDRQRQRESDQRIARILAARREANRQFYSG